MSAPPTTASDALREFVGIDVLQASHDGSLCRIGERTVWIGKHHVPYGVLPKMGATEVVLFAWAADDLDLT